MFVNSRPKSMDRSRNRERLRSLLCAASLLTVLMLLISGCSHRHRSTKANVPSTPQQQSAGIPSRTPSSPASPRGYAEEGIASWYGLPFNGRPAADGEIYNMEALVAAHRTLPFNTWLRVTNLANGKSVNVRVIDRGPFIEGRILDLSKAAARNLELLGPGTGKIRLEVISAPPDRPLNDFYTVQIGAFSVRANAEQARQSFAERFGAAYIAPKQGRILLYRVLVGKEGSVDAALRLASVLKPENKDVFVVRLDESVLLENAANGGARSTFNTLPPSPHLQR